MELLFALSVGAGLVRPDLDPRALVLTVPDARGTYTIPYIQSAPQLPVRVEFHSQTVRDVTLCLTREGQTCAVLTATPQEALVHVGPLEPGEYELCATGRDADGAALGEMRLHGIGIGTVIAALGDSITEGYFGNGFQRGDDLSWQDFPPEAVSADRRNFPQFSPTTAWHLPQVNCFQSWMTDLNNLLSASWGRPVFIANEGWGGYTTADYLKLMRTDTNWEARIRLLQPTVWLIHLGINDERAQVSADRFEATLAEIVRVLLETYGAAPDKVFVARPAYDYAEGAESILRGYCERVDALVARLGLSPGPDFFAAFSHDRERWYGEDPVHPNSDGMIRMAGLWAEAILRALPGDERR